MSTFAKILLVEDDLNLGMILKEFLEVKGFEVLLAEDGSKAETAAENSVFDLFILDVMLPKVDGFTLAKNIRKINTITPIIFLTAKSMQEDKIKGLKLGADDYITKPFSTEELFLRINAIMRRIGNNGNIREAEKYKIGEYQFSPEANQLIYGEEEMKLTHKEAELLKLLILNKNSVVERSVALNKIWNDDNYFTSRSMDVYIAKLRNYLKMDKNVAIKNIHGKGYKLTCN